MIGSRLTAHARGRFGGEPNPEFAKSKMLIIHSSDELYGSDRVLLEVVTALEQDIDIRVWLPQDVIGGERSLSKELRRRGIETNHERLPILRRKLMNPRGMAVILRNLVACTRRLRKQQFDIVYLMTSACLPAAPMARVLGFKEVLIHIQEPWVGRDAAGLKLLSRFTTQQIAISRTVAETARRSTTEIQIVPNGVPQPDVDHLTGLPGAASNGPTYVVASRWNSYKGHETLLRAWEAAGCPGRLQILGGPPDHGMGIDVASLVSCLVSDPSSVEIVGQVPDTTPYVFAADAVIVPSDGIEGFGLVVIEAFALGKPAIVSSDGGPAEIVTHARDGYVFERGNASSLGDLLKSLDRDQLACAGIHAAEAYFSRYSVERFGDDIRQTILRIISTK